MLSIVFNIITDMIISNAFSQLFNPDNFVLLLFFLIFYASNSGIFHKQEKKTVQCPIDCSTDFFKFRMTFIAKEWYTFP